jgi:hypothetical protein
MVKENNGDGSNMKKFIRNHLLIHYAVVLLGCSQERVDTCRYRVDTCL